jgi:lysophospholipase L1-like esterase
MAGNHERRLSRRALLAAGATAAVGVGATVSGVALAGSTRRAAVVDQLVRSVGVIGDSITQESEDLLYQLLRNDGFARVRIEAERSRRIRVSGSGGVPRAGLSVMGDFVEEGFAPTAWVIALGTNDIGSYADGAAFAELIDAMLFFVPPTTPLVWVDTFLPDRLENCVTLNTELRRILAARGAASVASWYDANLRPGESLLRSDRIHPNERGRIVFPTIITSELRRLLLSL